MKNLLFALVAITTTIVLSGCCGGYNAPFYKPSVIGCAPAFVPTR